MSEERPPRSPEALLIHTKPHRVGLRVEVRGPGTYENTLAYWRSIAAALGERRPAGLLLVDETVGEPLSPLQWKALVQAMEGAGLEKLRIAHVKPHGLERIEYCELYAREAGLDARVFTDENEADLWLRHGERARSA